MGVGAGAIAARPGGFYRGAGVAGPGWGGYGYRTGAIARPGYGVRAPYYGRVAGAYRPYYGGYYGRRYPYYRTAAAVGAALSYPYYGASYDYPYYGAAYGSDCYWVRQRVVGAYGRVGIRRVQVCGY
jgi:hypothetical protein